jgi:hypothetical protein
MHVMVAPEDGIFISFVTAISYSVFASRRGNSNICAGVAFPDWQISFDASVKDSSKHRNRRISFVWFR